MLALVGESGSGKTMAARAVLGLLPAADRRTRQAASGSTANWSASRRRRCANPRRPYRHGVPGADGVAQSVNAIGQQMAEGLRVASPPAVAPEIRERCLTMLKRVSIPNPEHCLDAYPHEFPAACASASCWPR
jgi:peptide/nickel transport system ATP-binding protein